MAGAAYTKKTEKAVCDELGPKFGYMQEFVEEAGKTSLCKTDGTNCDERSLKFLNKMKTESPATYQAQLDRLTKLLEGDMKADLKAWVKMRMKILSRLLAEAPSVPVKEEL